MSAGPVGSHGPMYVMDPRSGFKLWLLPAEASTCPQIEDVCRVYDAGEKLCDHMRTAPFFSRMRGAMCGLLSEAMGGDDFVRRDLASRLTLVNWYELAKAIEDSSVGSANYKGLVDAVELLILGAGSDELYSPFNTTLRLVDEMKRRGVTVCAFQLAVLNVTGSLELLAF